MVGECSIGTQEVRVSCLRRDKCLQVLQIFVQGLVVAAVLVISDTRDTEIL